MKTHDAICHAAIISLTGLLPANAAVRYVNVSSTNAIAPYTNWSTAAATIQAAVDVALAGDEIVVTNGSYASGGRWTVSDSTPNRVVVDKPLSLRSVNGPLSTSIDGGGSNRCVFMTNGTSLSGFTLTNGFAREGAGLRCASVDAVISNCVVAGNSCSDSAVSKPAGGGVYGGTLYDCKLSGNEALGELAGQGSGFGGGAYLSRLYNCTLTGNSAFFGGAAASCVLSNCTLGGNSARWHGGGVYVGRLANCKLFGNSAHLGGAAMRSILNNCTLNGNSAAYYGGGANSCTLNNCMLRDNNAGWYGGGAYEGTLNNCTLTGNMASEGGGAIFSTLNNCIIYSNIADEDANSSCCVLNYSCSTPQPINGVGNITNAPLFVNLEEGNLRLQSNSPCINAGWNIYVETRPDLAGSLRIVGGAVDMGAYEFQSPQTKLSYAWLQQYGFPTDGSADAADPDNDGHNNWQEWRAWTDPTNALSALKQLTPQPATNGVQVSWQSVSGQNYFLERATNAGASFSIVQINIPGQASMTSFTDTNIAGENIFLYRVGVP